MDAAQHCQKLNLVLCHCHYICLFSLLGIKDVWRSGVVSSCFRSKRYSHHWYKKIQHKMWECGGEVVEHRTPNQRVLGLIPTGRTVMYP